MTIHRRNEVTFCHVSSRFDVAACSQGVHGIFDGAPGLRVGTE